MKRGFIAAGAVAMLLLTGCTATGQPAIDSSEAIAGTAASESPLVAETPTAAAAADGGETAFLAEVRAKLRPDNVIPNATDEQLLAAGQKACEVLATTANTNTVSLIEGEPANGLGYYTDSGVIITAARGTLCN